MDLDEPDRPCRRKFRCNGKPFQGNCVYVAARRHVRAKGGVMLLNLHLWEAPVRNFDWVTSAFGYR